MIDHFLIIDEHCHTYPTAEKAQRVLGAFNDIYKTMPIHIGNGTVDEVLLTMEHGGIDFTVLANFGPLKILHENNLWTLSLHQKHPGLIPLVGVHPDLPGDLVERVKNYRAMGARGIKIHPTAQGFIPNHPKLQRLYAYCNETHFPVVFHCGVVAQLKVNNFSDIDQIMPIIKRYTEVPLVLTHMAEGNRDDILRIAERYPHVFFDTSIAVSGFRCIERVHDRCWEEDQTMIALVRQVGAERFLFGSDYPFGSPIHDVDRFLAMDLTRAEKAKLVGENAAALFHIDVSDVKEGK